MATGWSLPFTRMRSSSRKTKPSSLAAEYVVFVDQDVRAVVLYSVLPGVRRGSRCRPGPCSRSAAWSPYWPTLATPVFRPMPMSRCGLPSGLPFLFASRGLAPSFSARYCKLWPRGRVLRRAHPRKPSPRRQCICQECRDVRKPDRVMSERYWFRKFARS